MESSNYRNRRNRILKVCDSMSKSKWFFSMWYPSQSSLKVIPMNKMLLFTLSTNIGSVCLLSESRDVVFIEYRLTDGLSWKHVMRCILKDRRRAFQSFYFYLKWYLDLCRKQRNRFEHARETLLLFLDCLF